MPISWTPDNDRKLLLLMLKSAGAVSVNRPEIRRLWGPDPPTENAITLRFQHLKKLAREQTSTSGDPTTPVSTPKKRTTPPKRRNGLITPHGSPQMGAKRKGNFSDDANDASTPRRNSKRKAAQNVKYEDPPPDFESEIEGGNGKVDLDDFDDDGDDEYKPNGDEDGEAIGDGDKIELKKEVVEGERLLDKQVGQTGLLKAADIRMKVDGAVTAGGEVQGIKNEVLYSDFIAVPKNFKGRHELGDFFVDPRPGKGLKGQAWV